MHYHLGNVNVVVDDLRILYMGSVRHVEKEGKELVKGFPIARTQWCSPSMEG